MLPSISDAQQLIAIARIFTKSFDLLACFFTTRCFSLASIVLILANLFLNGCLFVLALFKSLTV